MFTGIVEQIGQVTQCRESAGGRCLSIDTGIVAGGVKLGASIAVNGVCLTVAGIHGTILDFDVINESLRRTNLGELTSGARVNLERSLTPGGRMDGHFVQGHVDGTAKVVERNVSPAEWKMWFEPGDTVTEYIIPKGSIAIDGISLTIADVDRDRFSVAIIPTTLRETVIEDRQVGDRVNIESDIITRTVVHQLKNMLGINSSVAANGSITQAFLTEHGFQ
jgi:riboflavin synthase